MLQQNFVSDNIRFQSICLPKGQFKHIVPEDGATAEMLMINTRGSERL